MNNMNQFLLNKWNDVDFGAKFYQIAGTADRHENNAYFFLSRELTITNHDEYLEAKHEGFIRHCKPYCGRWLDYVVQKEFKTLEAWVNDCGAVLSDVLYGTNRVHQYIWREGVKVSQRPVYVQLSRLLGFLGFGAVNNPEVEPEPMDIKVEEIMKRTGITLDQIWVIRDGTPIQFKTFILNA